MNEDAFIFTGGPSNISWAFIYWILFAFSPAANGHVATIELLLKEGADPSLKDIHGRDALTVACVKANEGNKDLVVQLLQVTSYM